MRKERLLGAVAATSLAVAILMVPAAATCPAFHQLQNGQTADASQVMDNFNYILQCPNFTGNVGIGTSNAGQTSFGGVYALLQLDEGASGERPIVLTGTSANHRTVALWDTTNSRGWIWSHRTDNTLQSYYYNGTSWVFPAIMTFDTSNNVGIATPAPAYTLDVAGTVRATTVLQSSDERQKTQIATLNISALDVVTRLRPVTFQWASPKDSAMQGTQTGLIAQEVESVLPNLILTSPEMVAQQKNASGNDVPVTVPAAKSIKYNELTVLLIKAVQEQQVEIRDLRNQIAALKK